jgi:hypothetical protein
VRVLGTTSTEFQVGEATCSGDSGGPALDEATGEIVGVVSRGGPSCDGPGVHNIYTRVDVFSALVDEALRRAEDTGQDPPDADGGVLAVPDAGKKSSGAPGSHKPPSDMGSACESGADCSSGLCVSEHGRRYCSRSCGQGDRCPAHFGCTKATSGASVCIQK